MVLKNTCSASVLSQIVGSPFLFGITPHGCFSKLRTLQNMVFLPTDYSPFNLYGKKHHHMIHHGIFSASSQLLLEQHQPPIHRNSTAQGGQAMRQRQQLSSHLLQSRHVSHPADAQAAGTIGLAMAAAQVGKGRENEKNMEMKMEDLRSLGLSP